MIMILHNSLGPNLELGRREEGKARSPEDLPAVRLP